ncbi:DUF1992 domain-containing protein [Oceanobacillus sp. Castelsardo]|uniref:DnaJ family domain-containing protein n=1 Tax=Oceanobacillus sp. Castelsardo TaxID=1851204 RepID=UPI000837F4DD|nr:DUF1992 domain-containing protein [Oceanobacillus sp. Castelsardo]
MYHIVEDRIKESMENGEFDNLPGKGEPLNVRDEFQGLSPEIRRTFKILKTAGYIPEENDKENLTFKDLHRFATGIESEQGQFECKRQFESFAKQRELKKNPSFRHYAEKIYNKLFR